MNRLHDLYSRYLAAWSARDADAIVALHASDTTFWLRHGRRPVTGTAAVRDAFAAMFAVLPQLEFDVHRTEFGSSHWVLDWTLKCVLPDGAGGGRDVSWDCMDLVTVTDHWQVLRKDTFVDGVAFEQALTPVTRRRPT